MSRKLPSGSTSSASSSKKKAKPKLKTAKFEYRDASEPPTKKLRPLSLSNPHIPISDPTKDDAPSTSSQTAPTRSQILRPSFGQLSAKDVKGKGKETGPPVYDEEENRLWVDKYEPTTEAELAVHKRKVEDVRRWLLEAFEGGPSSKLRKYRRILALTGPAGAAKTATLRVLARELDFEILEWRNSISERGPSYSNEEFDDYDEPRRDIEALFDKFQAFLTRAMTCNSIFGNTAAPSQSAHTSSPSKRQLILLEDLPNLLHLPTQARFQAALQSLCIPSFSTPGPPIVIIVSDSGLRAEQPDDDTWDGGSAGRRWAKKEVLDIRNVLGPELLKSPYVTSIGFNPIAPTLMTKALQALLALHFGSPASHGKTGKQPAREVLDIIVESSNGDIRSAVMALQFACVVALPTSAGKAKGKGSRRAEREGGGGTSEGKSVRAVLEAVTRREQSLVLFHLMGKILYNKRKSDPPASHLSAKEAAKERESDALLLDPPPLPEWLSHHDRRASRVCVETLASDSPIDSSLLGTYIHQNYTQFCTDIDQCDGVCEGLSWADCVGGTQFTNTPYAFPTLTLSTLHALPTPVPRTGQKVCKPAWFDVRAKETEAWDAVGDVLSWLGRRSPLGVGAASEEDEEGVGSTGRWTHTSIATELGGWLRAVERSPVQSLPQVPRSYRLFSVLPWGSGVVGGDALGENDDGEVDGEVEEGDVRVLGALKDGEGGDGWWLEDDDIEEVE
ncbi:hypothetical protein HYDPIDRAFT_158739 [Hydnomerulius pinastri MD-312]|uniref:Checkpoint protein RAD24-like helical bundle domain-containing protein n=1 Tax=Hydnomerulius pinastri MD-312 TaxID=994086 RepID=A0A0C9VUS9_9AGAM|nr:hypothetical protein HYDPIDRAFT_158739 [Hydnomerulius pinastri MD-312]